MASNTITVTITARDLVTAALMRTLRAFATGGPSGGFTGYSWTYTPSDHYTTPYSIWRRQRARASGQRARGHHRPHRR